MFYDDLQLAYPEELKIGTQYIMYNSPPTSRPLDLAIVLRIINSYGKLNYRRSIARFIIERLMKWEVLLVFSIYLGHEDTTS